MRRTAKPRSQSSGRIFLACGVEVCLNLFPGATAMHLFSETRRASSMVACNGRGDPALTSPLAPVMGRLKIHRLGGPLRGFVQQALKLSRRLDV
jgi:hypothetical protein